MRISLEDIRAALALAELEHARLKAIEDAANVAKRAAETAALDYYQTLHKLREECKTAEAEAQRACEWVQLRRSNQWGVEFLHWPWGKSAAELPDPIRLLLPDGTKITSPLLLVEVRGTVSDMGREYETRSVIPHFEISVGGLVTKQPLDTPGVLVRNPLFVESEATR
jgi:hypothetical protein